jgi:AraC-like DNA-binding protein
MNECSLALLPCPTWGIALKKIWRVEESLAYNISCRSHERSGYVAIRTLGGAGELGLNNVGIVTLREQTLFICEYRDLYHYRCIEPLWKFWWFEFDATHTRLIPLSTIVNCISAPEEMGTFEAIFALLQKNLPESGLSVSSIFEATLSDYIHNWQIGKTQNSFQSKIAPAIESMQANPGGGLDIPTLAARCDMGERRFRDVFRIATGMAPKKYYDTLRLALADSYLKSSRIPLKEIASNLGYCNPFHFSREYHKNFGCAPSQVRG